MRYVWYDASMTDSIASQTQVLSFWFGDEYEKGNEKEGKNFWFTKRDETDQYIRERFEATVSAARRGKLDTWAGTARGRLALIIVLDQFPRNIHRDTPEAFASDAQALALAKEGIVKGMDKELEGHEQAFFYMPFMHSEDLADQERSVALFTKLAEAGTWDASWAIKHKKVIDRFGRYPHRNSILGRVSTPEELEYLKDPNAGF